MRHPLRAAPVARLIGLAALGSMLLAGCSDPKPSPAEERRDRIEARLRSFSAAQASCILGRLDQDTLAAIDRPTGTLGRAAMEEYTDAVVACVTRPEGSATTTTR